jgi:hypothetical protein
LGLGILTGIDLAASALRAEFVDNATREHLNLVITGASSVCVLIWLGYLLAPEPEPAPPTVLPHNEVETWNRELRRFLK